MSSTSCRRAREGSDEGAPFYSTFQALELGFVAIRQLRRPLAKLQKKDKDLHGQLKRSLTGAVANMAEGRRRRGADQVHRYRIAAGEADEALNWLRIALELGYVNRAEVIDGGRSLDRVLRILSKLTR